MLGKFIAVHPALYILENVPVITSADVTLCFFGITVYIKFFHKQLEQGDWYAVMSVIVLCL